MRCDTLSFLLPSFFCFSLHHFQIPIHCHEHTILNTNPRDLLYPIVVIPGQSGNQLEARLTNSYKNHTHNQSWNCWSGDYGEKEKKQSQREWFRLWLNYTRLKQDSISQRQSCFAEQISLAFDPKSDDYRNFPGVVTRVPFFGTTLGFRYRDPDQKDQFIYMARLVERLEEIGYTEGENLFGAPYDFRYGLAASGHPSKVGSKYLQDLKGLIETASRLNQNKPVILLSHSLGGLLTLQLLNRNSRSWRRNFIQHFIALSTPWGGTVLEMQIFASGSTLGFSFMDPLIMRQETRSLESDLWLLPSPFVFGQKPLVITKHNNYSASSIQDFLVGIGSSDSVRPYETRILPLISELPAPGVPVTCMTGFGVDTPEVLVYGDNGFDSGPNVVYGDGDGLVNLVSLLAVESVWSDQMEQELKVIKIKNVSHEGILKDEAGLREVIRQVYEANFVSRKLISAL